MGNGTKGGRQKKMPVTPVVGGWVGVRKMDMMEGVRFFWRFFYRVFELPSPRNARKRDKTKKVEEKLTSKILSIFLGKVFDMDFLQKYFYGVLEPPLAEKRPKTY
jgi:hypothetical protein